RHELGGERTLIGRSKDCDIQLADPNVSRRHAEVRRDGDAFLLVDLDSTNGIEVSGKRVRRLELHDGERFTIGSTEVVFWEELAGELSDSGLGQRRDDAAPAEDCVPRPALSLHLADRPPRRARPAPAAGIDDPLAPAGLRPPSATGRP